MKRCCTCKIEKPFSEFSKRTRNKDGLCEQCRQCRAVAKKKYRTENEEKVLLKKRESYYRHKEKTSVTRRLKYNDPEVKKIGSLKGKEYRVKNREAISLRRKEIYVDKKEIILARNKKSRIINADRIKEQGKKRRQNPEIKIKNRERHSKWKKIEYVINPLYALKERVRARIRAALRNKTAKADKTIELVGCTFGELQSHLEKQFKPGMTWENMKEWHIDHIKPCAAFDLSDPEQQRSCFHYTNIQPLWALENITKGIKYNPVTCT